jgi:hypothetical protein
MELKSAVIETQPSMIFKGRQEALLLPIGDVQLDPLMEGTKRRAHVRRLRQVVEWGADHGAHGLGIGDMVDPISPSNRQTLKTGKIYDSWRQTMEKEAKELEDELVDIFQPLNWLGMVAGHHYWPFEAGGTTDTHLAERLGCHFLGDMGLLRVSLPSQSGHHRRPSFDALLWHGEGSGATVAAPLNKLEKQVAGKRADVYFMGHYHRAAATKMPELIAVGGERGSDPILAHRDRLLVATGSFMRSYMQGSQAEGRPQGSYVEKAGMPPAALGNIVVFARPRQIGNGYATVDFDHMSI